MRYSFPPLALRRFASILVVAVGLSAVVGCGSGDKSTSSTPVKSKGNDAKVVRPTMPRATSWKVTLPYSSSERAYYDSSVRLGETGDVCLVEVSEATNRQQLISTEPLTGDFAVELIVRRRPTPSLEKPLIFGFRPVDGTQTKIGHAVNDLTAEKDHRVSVRRINGLVGIIMDGVSIFPRGVRNTAVGHVYFELNQPMRIDIEKLEVTGEQTEQQVTGKTPGVPLTFAAPDWRALDAETGTLRDPNEGWKLEALADRMVITRGENARMPLAFARPLEGDFYWSMVVVAKRSGKEDASLAIELVPANAMSNPVTYSRQLTGEPQTWLIECVRRGDFIRVLRDGGVVKQARFAGGELPMRFAISGQGAFEVEVKQITLGNFDQPDEKEPK